MPLHLLGKKSWNVYNADNIARVRRDEAAAQAAEEAQEQRMQEIDAQRRLAILRGEALPPLEDEADDGGARIEASADPSPHDLPGAPRRRRKRHGEDDTDFELRLAIERNESSASARAVIRRPASSAAIVDHAGHINLFGDERSRAHAEKNEEAEKESRDKKREYEDQYTMRFSNAAGKNGLDRPWYSQSGPPAGDAPAKDVWGNEDPRRRERQAQRLVANDPLAMMKEGAAKVRELKQERRRQLEDREAELKEWRKEDGRRERETRRGERRPRHRSRLRSPSGLSDRTRRRSRDGRDGREGECRDARRDGAGGRRRRGDSRSRSPDPGSRRRRHD